MQKFEEVCEVVKLIPLGKVTSYGAIAKYLSTGARLVGWAMNSSHNLNIPAHRVVNFKGVLTGKNHFSNPFLMQELLEKEGHKVVNNQIINFKEVFWDPRLALEL